MNETTGINWGEIYTAILLMVLPPLIGWLVAQAARGLRAMWKVLMERVKASLTAEQLAVAEMLAGQAVMMAEQIWHKPDVQAEFASKKELAFDYVDRNLQRLGIKMTAQDIGAMIESAVFDEINRTKLEPVQTATLVVQPETVQVVEAPLAQSPAC